MQRLGSCSHLTIAGAMMLATSPALAQNSSVAVNEPSEEQPPPEVRTSQNEGLQDIVVTATKREERAQRVPIAITTLNAPDLEALGSADTKALTQAVPGLSFFSVGNIAQVFLRGVGTSGGSLGDESSVAMYVDGVYQSSIVGSVFAFNNIRAIEVDKGPQGTLFGRNSTGGVIQIATRDPSPNPALDVSATYANYGTIRGSLYATGGIADGLAADIAVYYSDQGDGWGRNLATGADVFKTRDFSIRNKWQWQLGPITTATLALDYNRSRTDTNLAFRVIPPAVLQGQPAFPGYYNVNINGRAGVLTESGGAALILEHEMDWASVKSITAYRRMKSDGYLDQDSTAVANLNIQPENFDRAFTQELQLISANPGPIRWVAGLFYLRDSAGYDGRGFQVATTAPISSLITDQTNDSIAVYGEATADLTSRLRLTAGARYTHDKRTIEAERYALPSRTLTVGFPVDREASFSKVTYRGIVSYDVTENVMTYISYSRGFKGGLFNSTDPLGEPVSPTTLDSIEAGFKSDLLDRRLRLNGSAYSYKFEDIQLNQIVSGANVLRNAARATIRGVELDFDAIPARGLRINGSLGYIHSRFDSFPNAPFYALLPGGGETLTIGDAKGLRVPQTPKFTGRILGEYAFDSSIGSWAVQGTLYHNSGYFFSPDNRLRQNSYELVGATIKWTSEDGALEASIWGQNLGGAKYLSYATQVTPFGDHGSPSPPRTYGVTLRIRL